mmetsp:Transcript_17696/g.51502  ORF Transcript_17696/g.51502 Transcript_17696/m.51502 type:complete len:299 (+) Transcript_17696:382-1278(+)
MKFSPAFMPYSRFKSTFLLLPRTRKNRISAIPYLLDHFSIVPKLVHKVVHALHDDALLPRWRLVHLQYLIPRGEVDTHILCRHRIHLLLFRLHNVGELRVPRFVETEVARDNSGELRLHRLGPAVGLALHRQFAVVARLDVGRESHLRPSQQSRQHGPHLPGVRVDPLLPHQHQVGIFLLHHLLEQLGRGEGLELHVIGPQVRLDVHGPVASHGQSRPERLRALLGTHRQCHDFVGLLGLLETDRLFHGDFAEGVHGHFHVVENDARGPVGVDADLYGICDEGRVEIFENICDPATLK